MKGSITIVNAIKKRHCNIRNLALIKVSLIASDV